MANADRHDMTMPDVAHPSLATLRHRIYSLDMDGIEPVADHERANTAPVRTVVESRLGQSGRRRDALALALEPQPRPTGSGAKS